MSNWLSVDPLGLYDPNKEVEHYIDGNHNGGYFNPRNTSVYGYTYQNPINYIAPNGKQTYFMHGTFANDFGMSTANMTKVQNLFGNKTSQNLQIVNSSNENVTLQNNHAHRKLFADKLSKNIIDNHAEGEPITLVSHSHGGSINIMIANKLEKHYKGEVKINLLTMSTPNRPDYQLEEGSNVNHYHVYNKFDLVQGDAHIDSDKVQNNSSRTFSGAKVNMEYKDSIFNTGGHSSYSDKNVKQWLPILTKQIESE